jgi:hypothetical protein
MLGVPFLNDEVSVEIDSRKVLDGAGQELRTYQAILMLHYLVGAKPSAPAGTWLTFREFDGGMFYYSAFESRSIARIIETFGSNVELLRKAAERLGGEQVAMGDVAVRFDVFPKVPIIVVVWQGDAELSPSANILFDSSAGTIFSTEDLTVVAGLVAGKLVKQARELS